MRRSVAVDTETASSTETESQLENTPRRMSDHETETSPSVFVTSEEVAPQMKTVTYPLTQILAHLCELLQEPRNEQPHRRYEETACSKTAGTSTRSAGRSDTW